MSDRNNRLMKKYTPYAPKTFQASILCLMKSWSNSTSGILSSLATSWRYFKFWLIRPQPACRDLIASDVALICAMDESVYSYGSKYGFDIG